MAHECAKEVLPRSGRLLAVRLRLACREGEGAISFGLVHIPVALNPASHEVGVDFGAIEDNPHRLDASLAAADLVICQTGCLNRNAYWLVKEHCKRTGKRYIYLESGSVAGFARSLAQVPER